MENKVVNKKEFDNIKKTHFNNKQKEFFDKELQIVIELLEKLQYGSITIIVQDGKVVQIDKNEKIRLK